MCQIICKTKEESVMIIMLEKMEQDLKECVNWDQLGYAYIFLIL